MDRINVTKTFMPPRKVFDSYVDKIWSSGQLTNQGPLLKKFEQAIEEELEVDNVQVVTNGTVAIQLALHALGIGEGEIITTPFSYVASTSAILWEHLTPVFVDIEPETFCIDADKIEASITKKTKAILAVHVFGNACDVDKIDSIALKHNLKVIYDGAHAFGSKYKGRSLLSYGDISTCSFHATKLFHTFEGGCVVIKDEKVAKKLDLIKRFGHHGDDHFTLGINGKMSEINAAMGLSVLPYLQEIISKRRILSKEYDRLIGDRLVILMQQEQTIYNYSYYPVVFRNEMELLIAVKKLNSANIYPRRYFFPTLNRLPYLNSTQSCPISESISTRILCLPIYSDLSKKQVEQIVGHLF